MKKLFLLVLLFISACTSKMTSPEVNLVDVQMLEPSLFETTISTKVRLTNPTNDTIKFNGSKYKLVLNGVDLGTAQSNQQVSIPPLGETTQSLKFRINNISMVSKIEDMINANEYDYKIESTFYTNKSFGFNPYKSTSTTTYY